MMIPNDRLEREGPEWEDHRGVDGPSDGFPIQRPPLVGYLEEDVIAVGSMATNAEIAENVSPSLLARSYKGGVWICVPISQVERR